jgi:6-phosphogluconolactonase
MRLRNHIFILALTLASLFAQSKGGKARIYVGTYTGPESKGIYTCDFSMADGSIKDLQLAAEVQNPSFVTVHPNKKFVYCVNEVSNFKGEKAGAVTAFRIDGNKLVKLNEQSSGGDGPCYVSIDKSGKNALVANYGGGSVAVLPINPDGSLKPHSAFVQHTGSSVDPSRQKEPHAHSINMDAQNHFAIAADLGLDQLLVYKLDPDQGTLTPNNPPFAKVPPGSGPRHFAFHPSAPYAFANGEISSTIIPLRYDSVKGTLTAMKPLSTLPPGWTGENSTAETQVHSSGKFVYVSNRGHNSIAAFQIEPSGQIKYIENESTGGKTPRNFCIDPSGNFIVAANADSDSLVVLKIDQKTGALSPTGHQIKAPKPVCVKFLVTNE